jgi:hypothetical protein
MAHLRNLTDGSTAIMIADFTSLPAADGYQPRENEWLFSYVTHGIFGPGGTTGLRMPAIGLVDASGRVFVRLALMHPEKWNQLRGTMIPPLVEKDRTINFPRLPNEPMW